MFVPPRSENKSLLISVSFPKILSRRFPVWTDIVDRWFPTSCGLSFVSVEWSSFLGAKFSCFSEVSFAGVVISSEASNTILLETFQEGFWHWLLSLPIVIQCASPWRELSISVNKSCQSFPCMNSWVSPRVRTNQSQLSFMSLISFGTQLLLLVVMIFSICDSWCSYHQDLKTNRCWFQFLFLKFGVSGNSGLNWYCGSLVFNLLKTSLNQSKGLLSWIPSFGVSLRWVSWV